MKTCRWNLINFSKFTNGLIKKEKTTQWENEKLRKVGLCFIAGYFIKPFKRQLYRLFCLMIKEYIYISRWIHTNNRALTLSCRRSLLYRKQSIDLPCKLIEWFLRDKDLRHGRVKTVFTHHTPKVYSHM